MIWSMGSASGGSNVTSSLDITAIDGSLARGQFLGCPDMSDNSTFVPPSDCGLSVPHVAGFTTGFGPEDPASPEPASGVVRRTSSTPSVAGTPFVFPPSAALHCLFTAIDDSEVSAPAEVSLFWV